MSAQHVDNIFEGNKLNNCINDVVEELRKAEHKFPGWPNDILHGVCIVAEESGEAVRAALHVVYESGSVEEYKKELIQTAAMAIRAILNLEKEPISAKDISLELDE